jgi:hypothetical protein
MTAVMGEYKVRRSCSRSLANTILKTEVLTDLLQFEIYPPLLLNF